MELARSERAKWVTRLGVLGFGFFFVKGLVWLALLAGGATVLMY